MSQQLLFQIPAEPAEAPAPQAPEAPPSRKTEKTRLSKKEWKDLKRKLVRERALALVHESASPEVEGLSKALTVSPRYEERNGPPDIRSRRTYRVRRSGRLASSNLPGKKRRRPCKYRKPGGPFPVSAEAVLNARTFLDGRREKEALLEMIEEDRKDRDRSRRFAR